MFQNYCRRIGFTKEKKICYHFTSKFIEEIPDPRTIKNNFLATLENPNTVDVKSAIIEHQKSSSKVCGADKNSTRP